MPPARPQISRTALVVRTVLWIVLSSVFILQSARRIASFHAAGLHAGWWSYTQLCLWSLALLFWLYTGWRDWTRRVS